MSPSLQPSIPLDEILEKDWQRQVVDLAEQLGYVVYHTFDSRRSTHGFPDLVLVRDRVVYLECKRENRTTSKLTAEQLRWLAKLKAAGAEVYVVRPSHLEPLAKILAARGDYILQTRRPLRDELNRELERSNAA